MGAWFRNHDLCMITSSNRSIFRVSDHLCREFTGHRWIPRTGALMFSLICAWLNAWVYNREAGVLRRHRAHCDVIVMLYRRHLLLPSEVHIHIRQKRIDTCRMKYDTATTTNRAEPTKAFDTLNHDFNFINWNIWILYTRWFEKNFPVLPFNAPL